MIEVPIKLKDKYKLVVIDNDKMNVEHRLLIFKENDSFYTLMEFFMSEKDMVYLQDFEKLKYSKKGSDFEGIVVLVNACNEVISTEWVKKKTKSAGIRLKSASGYCVWLSWIYDDGRIVPIALVYCVLPEEDSGSGGGSGGSGGEATEPEEGAEALPEVYDKDLEQNVKAKCIYDNLMDGSILNDFIARYFPPQKPWLPALGELNLTWTLGNSTKTIPINDPNNSEINSVVIQLDESSLNNRSSSENALNMLHEALHAKLIAEVYDEVGTTDFKQLYQYYKGWGFNDLDMQQEYEMLTTYCSDIAIGLKNFDETQGISEPLEAYKQAIRYDISYEVFNIGVSHDDYAAYLKLLIKSPKICNSDE